MKDLSELGLAYDQALREFNAKIEDGRRQWAARVLRSYPTKQDLEATANALLVDIGADSVEVNAIADDVQATIVKAPTTNHEESTVPLDESLCVITVGLGEPAMIKDLQSSQFIGADHAVRHRGLKSWASAPIMIEGVCAGTVCALEARQPRDWNERDQALLEQAAGMISAQVNHWAADKKYKI